MLIAFNAMVALDPHARRQGLYDDIGNFLDPPEGGGRVGRPGSGSLPPGPDPGTAAESAHEPTGSGRGYLTRVTFPRAWGPAFSGARRSAPRRRRPGDTPLRAPWRGARSIAGSARIGSLRAASARR